MSFQIDQDIIYAFFLKPYNILLKKKLKNQQKN